MDEKYDYPGEHYRTQNSAWAHPCYYRAYHVSCYPFMSSQEFLVKSHGQRSLEGYSPKGPKESDTTEWLNIQASRASLPRWHSGKESPCQCRRHRRPRFNPWVGKIPWSTKWQPLQYSCLENPMDRGATGATVHWVAKSGSWLSMRALYYITRIAGAHLQIASLCISPEILLRHTEPALFTCSAEPKSLRINAAKFTLHCREPSSRND